MKSLSVNPAIAMLFLIVDQIHSAAVGPVAARGRGLSHNCFREVSWDNYCWYCEEYCLPRSSSAYTTCSSLHCAPPPSPSPPPPSPSPPPSPPPQRVIPPYRSHLQTKVLQSADKICILSFLFTPHPCLCSPPSVACCNLYLQSGICRPCPQPCSSPLPRMLQSAFAIWDLQTPPLSPSLR